LLLLQGEERQLEDVVVDVDDEKMVRRRSKNIGGGRNKG